MSSQTDDASIVAALSAYPIGPCLVAIDAPLVVTNPTGNRPAEKALNKDYRAFQEIGRASCRDRVFAVV